MGHCAKAVEDESAKLSDVSWDRVCGEARGRSGSDDRGVRI